MSKGVALSVDGWSAASLTVTIGAPDTWTPSADILTMVEAGVELLAWLEDAARPWFGAALFTVEVMETLSPWLGLDLTVNGACTLAPDAELQALLDWPAIQQGPATIYTQTGVTSTVDGPTDIGGYIKRVPDSGGIARNGSYVSESQPYAIRRPTVEMLGKEAVMAALGEAQALSSDPRHGSFWRPATGEWVTLQIGRIESSREQMPIYRTNFEAVG